jgi:hypothetical protein
MYPVTDPSPPRRLTTRRAVALAGLAAAALVIAALLADRGEGAEVPTARDCALAWNRTAGDVERDLLNKDAQVARGSEEERRVRLLVTAHDGDDERFTRLDGGQGVASPGACMVIEDRTPRDGLILGLDGATLR